MTQTSARKPAGLSMLVYGGGAVVLPGFDHPLVIDLARLKTPRTVPILRNRDGNRIVGHTIGVSISGGRILVARGVASGGNNDAIETVASAKAGFPWAVEPKLTIASAGFVAKGETANVNRRKFAGPLFVSRRASVVNLSVVLSSFDDDTFLKTP